MGWFKNLRTRRKIRKIESIMEGIDQGIHHCECMINYHKQHISIKGKEYIKHYEQEIDKFIILKERARCRLLTSKSSINH